MGEIHGLAGLFNRDILLPLVKGQCKAYGIMILSVSGGIMAEQVNFLEPGSRFENVVHFQSIRTKITMLAKPTHIHPSDQYPLRGKPFHYKDPGEPVAMDDWSTMNNGTPIFPL